MPEFTPLATCQKSFVLIRVLNLLSQKRGYLSECPVKLILQKDLQNTLCRAHFPLKCVVPCAIVRFQTHSHLHGFED